MYWMIGISKKGKYMTELDRLNMFTQLWDYVVLKSLRWLGCTHGYFDEMGMITKEYVQ